jgi:primase-polymerase (primpol)-like protein
MSSDIDTSLIPDQLAELEQWVCWQATERDGKQTKVPIKPYHTNGTEHASTTDATTWRNLDTALAFHESDRVQTDGIGFVFAPETHIVGVDLDECRDPESGELTPWARDIVDRLDSYTEISPSGRGVHVLVEGELPPGRKRRGDVEMYDEARFFTVTANHRTGTPTTLSRRQEALLRVHHEYVQSAPADTVSEQSHEQSTDSEARTQHSPASDSDEGVPGTESAGDEPLAIGSDSGLYARYGLDYPAIDDSALEAALHGLSPTALPSPLPTSLEDISGPGVDLDDEVLLQRAMDSKSGDIIEALYEGRIELWQGRDSRYASQSEADMGLCFYLGFWTGGDPERIDRLFRQSELMRGKWDRVHFANGATYGDVCIARTLLQVNDYYSPPPTSTTRERPTHRPPSTAADVPPSEPTPATAIDAQAIEDAKRLATKVEQQQRELQAQRDRIETLEAQIQWYRQALGMQSNSLPVESSETGQRASPSSAAWSHTKPTPKIGDEEGSHEIGREATSGDHNDEDESSKLEEEASGELSVADRLRRWFS